MAFRAHVQSPRPRKRATGAYLGRSRSGRESGRNGGTDHFSPERPELRRSPLLTSYESTRLARLGDHPRWGSRDHRRSDFPRSRPRPPDGAPRGVRVRRSWACRPRLPAQLAYRPHHLPLYLRRRHLSARIAGDTARRYQPRRRPPRHPGVARRRMRRIFGRLRLLSKRSAGDLIWSGDDAAPGPDPDRPCHRCPGRRLLRPPHARWLRAVDPRSVHRRANKRS